MRSGSNWDQIGNITFYIPNVTNLCRKRISMLTRLKVLFLACKCLFYRPEHNAKGVCKCSFYRPEHNAKGGGDAMN